MKRFFALAAIAVALLLTSCSSDGDGDGADSGTDEIEGLRTYDDLSNGHMSGELEYDQWPPVGGDHNPLWQKCGFYSVRVPPERAVHSMEHGSVWVAYSADESLEDLGDDLADLLARSVEDEFLLVSPLEDLATPFVASAWGAQIDLESADDPRLDAFIAAYSENGPERAPCVQGGVGNPAEDAGPGLDL
ncbi:MAG: DUF3105 domain-containing protein [Acidimicrobiales bacterium]